MSELKGMSGHDLFVKMLYIDKDQRHELLKDWHKANTEPNIFWLAEDPDYGADSISELLEYHDIEHGEEPVIIQAFNLPRIIVKVSVNDGGDRDYEVIPCQE